MSKVQRERLDVQLRGTSEGALGGLRRLVCDLRLDAHLHGDLILTGLRGW